MARFRVWLSLLPAELAIEASLPVRYAEDPGDWYLFDSLVAVAIAIEVMVAASVYGYLWSHGQI